MKSRTQIEKMPQMDPLVWIKNQHDLIVLSVSAPNKDTKKLTITKINLISADVKDAFSKIKKHLESNQESQSFDLTKLDEDRQKQVIFQTYIYQYGFKKPAFSNTQTLLHSLSKKVCAQIELEAQGVNLARHLVNLPPNWLHPKSYTEIVGRLFKGVGLKAEVIQSSDLKDGRTFGLLDAVGAAAEHPPSILHLMIPATVKSKKAPVILVGKGITFDSGGLNLKPGNSMRLMKKDMGGSACAVGTAWIQSQREKRSYDFHMFLALAENAVSANAMRPGDIYKSYAGKTIEIDNTDAEGRLVLADAMAYANEVVKKPRLMITAATLTGAARVAIGKKLFALFGNNESLTVEFQKLSHACSDPGWTLPLYKEYASLLSSTVADLKNSDNSGFAGAITAALFLEEFVPSELDWLHLDMYAYADSGNGAIREAGGNGQGVVALSRCLQI